MSKRLGHVSKKTDAPRAQDRDLTDQGAACELGLPSRAEILRARRKLISWFHRHGRDFPWRQTEDPYAVWVSEVMLQQTTTSVVKEYFHRFMARFPTVGSLAIADETEVLKMWEGLGYYRRARHLHQAAQIIVSSYGGEFPCKLEELMQLPGIGRYTAGAILSLAFNRPVAIVETNIRRLLRRWLGIGPDQIRRQERLLWKVAQEFLSPRRARIINLALMDLGHLVCTPRRPLCGECPIREGCRTFQTGLSPVGPGRSSRQLIPRHEMAVILESEGCFWMIRRGRGRWSALWDFPRVLIAEGTEVDGRLDPPDSRRLFGAPSGEVPGLGRLCVREARHLCRIRHQVTRYQILLDAYLLRGVSRARVALPPDALEGRWATAQELAALPTPAPTRRLIWRLQEMWRGARGA